MSTANSSSSTQHFIEGGQQIQETETNVGVFFDTHGESPQTPLTNYTILWVLESGDTL